MAIFNSYVSLPEGTCADACPACPTTVTRNCFGAWERNPWSTCWPLPNRYQLQFSHFSSYNPQHHLQFLDFTYNSQDVSLTTRNITYISSTSLWTGEGLFSTCHLGFCLEGWERVINHPQLATTTVWGGGDGANPPGLPNVTQWHLQKFRAVRQKEVGQNTVHTGLPKTPSRGVFSGQAHVYFRILVQTSCVFVGATYPNCSAHIPFSSKPSIFGKSTVDECGKHVLVTSAGRYEWLPHWKWF